MPYVVHPEQHATATSEPPGPDDDLERGLYGCQQGEDVQIVAYVSKMFAVRKADLPAFKPREMTADEMRQRGKEQREKRAAMAQANGIEPITGKPLDEVSAEMEALDIQDTAALPVDKPEEQSAEVLLGFSRVFSGTLHRDTSVTVTLPKYDPTLPSTHPRNEKYVTTVIVKDLYTMMGRELVAVDEVPAGHVCAIGGLDGAVFRNATLWAAGGICTSKGRMPDKMINLAGVSMQAAPIVRVALEPDNPSE